ncbi:MULTISPECIES: ferredoxin [Micromonospora]|uniref:ferredoxin n=1 Tax=Micromonospora TaxID=1873 RepID=UPI0006AE6CD9|nr:ferredoxin [Micromonospora sp. NRRL B-16802]KOX03180.1 ferredoxin [Micromonospora sp. NRRL B-16802]
MRVSVDAGACVGAGLCVLTAPEVFDQDPEDGIATVRAQDLSADSVEAVREARSVCPVEAIELREE